MDVNRLISPLSEQENNQLRELVEQSVLCGVDSQFSEGPFSDSSFLYHHQLADIQHFARTHQASASPQKSSIIWTCSLLQPESRKIFRFFLALGYLRSRVWFEVFRGHTQNSVGMQSINLLVNSIFTIFTIEKKKDLDITFAMRNRPEWFNEKMAAVSPEIVSYFFASNALLTTGGGYNHLVISNISESYRGLRKEFRGFSRTRMNNNSNNS